MKDGVLSDAELLQFRQTETCSDCIDRNDVDLLGRPRKNLHSRVRRCSRCGSEEGRLRGTGRVRRQKAPTSSWLS